MRTSRVPNLYLVGAPKCGTTSVAAALDAHANIYVGPVKEPWYLNTDFGPRNIVEEEKYRACYEGALPEHEFVCDASTTYLYSRDARAHIASRDDALVIIMVRNPVDMALSWFAHKKLTLEEDLEDFEAAWHAIDDRRAGLRLPKALREKRWLLYDEMASLGSQCSRWIDDLGMDRVMICSLEGLARDSSAFYHDLFSFLGLESPPTGSLHEEPLNARRRMRSRVLAQLLDGAARLKSKYLPVSTGTNLLSRLQSANSTRLPSARNLSAHLEQELTDFFEDETSLINRLTGRGRSLPGRS